MRETDKTNATGHGQADKTHIEFKSITLKGLFMIAFFYALYFARGLILPFTLALLLNFLLRPVVRVLKKINIPELAGAALVLVALLGSAGYGVIRLSGPAAEWINRAPEGLHQIELKVGFLRKPLEGINNAVEELKRITRMGAEEKPEVQIRPPPYHRCRFDRYKGSYRKKLGDAHPSLFPSCLGGLILTQVD